MAAVIAAVVIIILAVAMVGAIAAIYTAGAYMQVFYENDRRIITKADKLRARFIWWRYKSPYKLCHKCCVFCEFTEHCAIEVSNLEAREQMQEQYKKLRAKKKSGQQLTEQEQEIYRELTDWERRRADNEKL